MKTPLVILLSTPIGMILAGIVFICIGVFCSYEEFYGFLLLMNPLAW